jgi:acyl carrier protein
MDDLKTRLMGCFKMVFPDLSDSAILVASQDSVAGWDSIAAITLLNLLEEEFGIEADLDALADLNSFEAVYQYVRQATATA